MGLFVALNDSDFLILGPAMGIMLEIKNLVTRFYTVEGTVHAVNGITYEMEEGATLGVVGESGCGKSVHALSIMRLIPSPPGKIEDGEIWFNGFNLKNKLNASIISFCK